MENRRKPLWNRATDCVKCFCLMQKPMVRNCGWTKTDLFFMSSTFASFDALEAFKNISTRDTVRSPFTYCLPRNR